MSTVIEFHPRRVYDELRWERLTHTQPVGENTDAVVLTGNERYRLYFAEAQSACLKLVRFYKASGVWNKDIDKQMTQIVHQFETLCQSMADAPVPERRLISKEIETHGQRSTSETFSTEDPTPRSA